MTPRLPNLRPAFRYAEPLTVNGDETLTDPDFNPGCGYISQTEAHLLYRIACDFPGDWVEIGSHTGWSGAHIAAARGVTLHAIEPLLAHPDFSLRTYGNWRRAKVDQHIRAHAVLAQKFFEQGPGIRFAGAFVDGDHDPPHPTLDTYMVLGDLADRCVVVYHDHVGRPVQEAVSVLRSRRFHVHVYETAQQLAVCWRGDWTPPE